MTQELIEYTNSGFGNNEDLPNYDNEGLANYNNEGSPTYISKSKKYLGEESIQ
ncbi:8357_t:CDS:1, partial [Cetraspora pellucida]